MTKMAVLPILTIYEKLEYCQMLENKAHDENPDRENPVTSPCCDSRLNE